MVKIQGKWLVDDFSSISGTGDGSSGDSPSQAPTEAPTEGATP